MGLFSSSYKTYVGTSVSSFGDVKQFVSSKKKGIISGMVRNESMLEHTFDYLINGSGFRAKKAFNYSGAEYTFGRPNDTVMSLANVKGVIALAANNYLLTTLGAQEVYYTKYGSQNYFHKLFQLLNTEHSFNFVTGALPLLTASKGVPVTLYSLRLLINPSYTDDNVSSYSPITFYPCEGVSSIAVSDVGAEMTYRWVSSAITNTSSSASSGTVLDSSTVTYAYSGGTASYSTSGSGVVTTVSAPVVVNTSTAAVPPVTYAPTQIATSTVTTTKVTTTTNNTYTVGPPVLTTLLSTAGTISVGGEVDLFSVTLSAGITYSFYSDKSSGSSLDPFMTLITATPTVVASDNDSGVGNNAYFTYTPTTSGVFSIGVNGFSGTTGSYTVLVTHLAASSTGTLVVDVYKLTETSYANTITTVKSNQATQNLSTSLAIPLIEKPNTYVMAAYRNSSGNLAFFNYEMNSGVSQLDASLSTSYTVPGDYLPRLYFRWNALPSNTDKTSIEYLHGKKLAKKMGISYEDTIDAIHKVDGSRTAADLESIKSAFLMYGVQADATSQIELEYLYKHFENWYGIIGGTFTTKSLTTFNSEMTKEQTFEHVLVIEDTRFKMTLGMQGVWKRQVSGSFGPVGSYGTVRGNLTIPISIDYGDFIQTFSETHPWHVYRHQSDTSTYTEYHVLGLETKYYVSGEHVSASGWTEDTADPKDVLYVPINYTIVQNMNVFDQEELMYKSMHIVVNSLVVIKVKWYQSEFWSLVFKVIALVALYYGFTAGFEFLYALGAVAGVSMVWAMELLFAALTDMLLNALVVKLFVKAVGEDLAFLAAMVATIYSMGSSGFKMNMPYAKELLAYSNAVFKNIGTSYQAKMEDLLGEFEAFNNEAKEQLDALNIIKDGLTKPSTLAKLYIGEPSEDFYARTIHAGNIGTRVYDLQTNYVDLALALPKTFNTLEV